MQAEISMESLERPIRTWIASERSEEIDTIVSEISNGNSRLLDVVKALGEYLTSEEDEMRTKGVELLSLVLGRCPPEKLGRQSVRVLVNFYCGKLEDTETIIPALKGLVSLTALPDFTSTDAVEVVKALIQHVKMKALVQSQRFLVFKIIDTLVAKHRDALKSMGKEFLAGYISLAEGEKDPRNLLLAFAINRVLLLEFDISAHIEDLFNITFCYFPITFRPPPDDPYGIKTDDLKTALSGCLNATPAFGSLAIPLFLEKLMAGSPITKRDTLQAMDSCLPIYGPATARNNARKLWNALKLEIFQPTDGATEEAALKTTQVLIQTIYSTDESENQSDKEDLQGLAKEACEECIQILREPEKSQAKPAIKVLCAFMATTPSVAQYTLSRVTPHLVKLFHDPDEIANRAPTLRLLSDFIAAARDSMQKDLEVLPEESGVPLASYKDEVLGVLTVGLKTASTAQPALDGLKGMVTTPGLLTDEELAFAVHNVNELLQSEGEENDDVRESALDLLVDTSSFAPRHVTETTLPLLFASLPDTAPPRKAQFERIKCWRTLASLSKLCKQPDLFETLVVRLLTKLDLICVPALAPAEAEADPEPSAAYAHSVLRTLADVLASKVERGDTDVIKYIDRLVPRVFNLFVYSALVADGTYMVATDPRLVAVAAQIVTLVMQTLPGQRQETFVMILFAGYLQGDVKQLAEGHQKIPSDRRFDPFHADAPSVQKNLLALFSAAIIAMRKEVKLPVPSEPAFLNTLLQWSVQHADNALQRDAITHSLASIINKHAEGIETFLNDRLDAFWAAQIAESSLPAEKRREALATWAWMTKAQLVRGDARAMAHAERLFTLFGDEAVSWDAARALGRVVSADKVLTKRNHAVIKILYAQRYCNAVLPRIVEGAKTSADPTQQNAYLVALTSLIKAVPRAIYAHQMSMLMPLLLRGLDLPDTEIRASVMDTLLAAAEQKDADSKDKGKVSSADGVIAEHASSLVATMLRNCIVVEMPSVRVRVAALRFLAAMPGTVRYDVLHPHKAGVLRELARALDDPKRVVRREAVEARTNWFKCSG
ncbi:ARM repeat-containing protein [Laetiporus sulphureus 93-53]|uniref:MMS19 nucleotide excision repair protein n=1 Tax=Laetiporus sulphureus 93-53 TaxID=1314785 RepID=A0A165EKY9_9APHY|nr:ARM repeat-containing protein [Laetiporus sulphureus 93-53]KZT07275.1 ARM repeat-containing protein [Laetiporus sulphureus 93-53]